MITRRRRRPGENLARNQPTNHRLIARELGYPTGSRGRNEWMESIQTFRKTYISPEGIHGPNLLRFQKQQRVLAEMARAYLYHDDNGYRYWPDNSAPGASGRLTYSQHEAEITGLLKQLFWRLNKIEKKYVATRRRKIRKGLNEYGQPEDPVPVDDLDFSDIQPFSPVPREASGPDNSSDFTKFSFAPKDEHTEAQPFPLLSVPPFAEHSAGHHTFSPLDGTPGQKYPVPDDMRASNGTECTANYGDLTTGNPNMRPAAIMSTTTFEPDFRSCYSIRASPRNRRRPQDPMYIYADGIEDLILSSSPSSDGSSSEREASPIHSGHGQTRVDAREPTNAPGELGGTLTGGCTGSQSMHQVVDDQSIEQVVVELMQDPGLGHHNTDTSQNGTRAATIPVDPLLVHRPDMSDMDEQPVKRTNSDPEAGRTGAVPRRATPTPATLPELRYAYQLILGRDSEYTEKESWQPHGLVFQMTWSQLEASLPAQLIAASDVLLIRLCAFRGVQGTQVEVRHGDNNDFELAKKQLLGRVEKFEQHFSHLGRIDLLVEIEAKTQLISGPPLLKREKRGNWL